MSEDEQELVEKVAEFIWRASIGRLDQPSYVWPVHSGHPDSWRQHAKRLLTEIEGAQ